MVSQTAKFFTGIEIHPAAKIAGGVFIDHGTGVVIGETAIIGDDVLIYQQVTLGGTGKEQGKRHPTIGNNVTIYSGASVLGDITIGDDSVVGGNVWLTESLPPGTKITALPPEHRRKSLNGNNAK